MLCRVLSKRRPLIVECFCRWDLLHLAPIRVNSRVSSSASEVHCSSALCLSFSHTSSTLRVFSQQTTTSLTSATAATTVINIDEERSLKRKQQNKRRRRTIERACWPQSYRTAAAGCWWSTEVKLALPLEAHANTCATVCLFEVVAFTAACILFFLVKLLIWIFALNWMNTSSSTKSSQNRAHQQLTIYINTTITAFAYISTYARIFSF